MLSLNLANNNMDEKCGELFEEATRANDTLIDFEFGFNNFSLGDVKVQLLTSIDSKDSGQPPKK